MSRYIDADALKEKIGNTAFLKLDDTEVVEQFIDAAPSIDIEPKRGKNLRADYPSLFECSVCGTSCDDTIPWDCDINFCPNCGAKMK